MKLFYLKLKFSVNIYIFKLTKLKKHIYLKFSIMYWLKFKCVNPPHSMLC